MSNDDLKIKDRTVRGDINLGSDRYRVAQVGTQVFLDQIDALLNLPGVTGLVWEQYTPYFNDGEECVFSVGEVRFLVDGTEGGDYELDYDTGFGEYDLRNWSGKSFIDLPGEADAEALYNAVRATDEATWESVCRANFGDHALVTATKDGFNVEFYEHD